MEVIAAGLPRDGKNRGIPAEMKTPFAIMLQVCIFSGERQIGWQHFSIPMTVRS